MRTTRVKVSQERGIPDIRLLALLLRLVSLSGDVVRDDLLVHDLGVAVGVRGAERAVLGDRDHAFEARGVAVDGCRGGEDDVGDVVTGHGAQEADGAEDVDAVVVEGDFGGLADGLVSKSVSCVARWQREAIPSAQQSG